MSGEGIPHDARPLRRQKLSEALAERLLGWIEDGMLPPGADLPSERGLMLKLGVGRSTVREAVAQLERMGVVSVGQGARARRLDALDQQHVPAEGALHRVCHGAGCRPEGGLGHVRERQGRAVEQA